MKDIVISRRYASALADVAQSEKLLETVQTEAKNVAELLKQDSFYKMVSSPAIGASERSKVILELHKKGHFGDLMRKFLLLLNSKNRISMLPIIMEELSKIIDERNNLVKVNVRFSHEPAESQKKELQDKIGNILKGKNPSYEYSVDADLIGGVVVHYGDKVYDASIKNELQKLKNS